MDYNELEGNIRSIRSHTIVHRPYTVDTVTLKGPYRTYVSYRMGASYG